MADSVAVKRRALQDSVETYPAVEFDKVNIAFDDIVVLRNLSFVVPRGTLRILLGASGSGKSVLLKLILGLLRPDSGIIRVNGRRIDDMTEAALLKVRADIGMVFQENALFDSLTVGENVGYALLQKGELPTDQIQSRVVEVLGFVGLAGYIDRVPSALSGGQRRRVAIARAMASQPQLLLLDDPTSGLDPIIATTVTDEIVKLRDLQHVTAIVATHQIRDAMHVATHRATDHGDHVTVTPNEEGQSSADFMVVHDGQVHFQGTAPELLKSTDKYLRALLNRALPPWQT